MQGFYLLVLMSKILIAKLRRMVNNHYSISIQYPIVHPISTVEQHFPILRSTNGTTIWTGATIQKAQNYKSEVSKNYWHIGKVCIIAHPSSKSSLKRRITLGISASRDRMEHIQHAQFCSRSAVHARNVQLCMQLPSA